MKNIQKFYIPLIGLALLILVYGGLSFADLFQQVKDNNNNLATLENKIADMNNNITAMQSATLAKTSNAEESTSSANPKSNIQTTEQIVQTTTTPSTNVSIPIKNISQATVTIENIGSFAVNVDSNDNAFSVLQKAGKANNFAVSYESYSFGVFVKGIGGIVPKGNQFWAFYYNGIFSNIGASAQSIKNGDLIFWQLSSF